MTRSDGSQMLTLRGPCTRQLVAKRLVDICFASLALLILSPLFLLIPVAVLVNSGWPVFYSPDRVGRNFTIFRQYKFRTMVKGANLQLPQVAHLNISRGMIKIPNDPRVTLVGRWLRRYSLDELPQLYNVIRGDMSLVGPRPYASDEVSVDNALDRKLLTMRPGLTGPWQITSRSSPSLQKRLQLDLDYVHQHSILCDLDIMLRTVPAVIGGRGGEVAPDA